MRTAFWVLGFSLLVLTSCSRPSASTVGSARVVDLQLREFQYAPLQITLRANELVMLRLRNVGVVEHEIQIGQVAQAGRGYTTDALAGVEVIVDGASRAAGSDGHTGHGHGQFMLAVSPGGTASATFNAPSRPGTYEFGCFIPGHYESGMRGELVIQ